MTLPELIEKYDLKKSYLARRLKMPLGTFSNKLLGGKYRLTKLESARLFAILKKMAIDIEKVEV